MAGNKRIVKQIIKFMRNRSLRRKFGLLFAWLPQKSRQDSHSLLFSCFRSKSTSSGFLPRCRAMSKFMHIHSYAWRITMKSQMVSAIE